MRISVIGAGSWGTAFAALLSDNFDDITLWGRDSSLMNEIRNSRENRRYLPGTNIPHNVALSNDLASAISGKTLVVLAVPAQELRSVLASGADYFGPDCLILSLIKGIEVSSRKRISELIAEELGHQYGTDEILNRTVVLSGPNHAEEVAKKIPSATVVSSNNAEAARRLQRAFNRDYFRVYTNDDVLGVELAGATKNVIAIAAGISDGLGFGDNTKASLLTRGLAEMVRLGIALGAKLETYYGLAGIGDLIATATSAHSRNRKAGEMIGNGLSLHDYEASTRMVAEGTRTVVPLLELGRQAGVSLPITSGVNAVLYGELSPLDAVRELMSRDLTSEN